MYICARKIIRVNNTEATSSNSIRFIKSLEMDGNVNEEKMYHGSKVNMQVSDVIYNNILKSI